jgi:hypothetical protein
MFLFSIRRLVLDRVGGAVGLTVEVLQRFNNGSHAVQVVQSNTKPEEKNRTRNVRVVLPLFWGWLRGGKGHRMYGARSQVACSLLRAHTDLRYGNSVGTAVYALRLTLQAMSVIGWDTQQRVAARQFVDYNAVKLATTAWSMQMRCKAKKFLLHVSQTRTCLSLSVVCLVFWQPAKWIHVRPLVAICQNSKNYNDWVGRSVRKRPLERRSCRWEDNSKMDLREMWLELDLSLYLGKVCHAIIHIWIGYVLVHIELSSDKWEAVIRLECSRLACVHFITAKDMGHLQDSVCQRMYTHRILWRTECRSERTVQTKTVGSTGGGRFCYHQWRK